MAPLAGRRWVPQQQVSAPLSLPIPTGGINTAVTMAAMAPNDAPYLFNMHPSSLGVRVRDGWEEHVVDETGIGAVRTIIPYGGYLSDNSDAKLFCATPSGIYDVTTSGTTATSKVAFGTTTGRAGYGSFANFRLAGGSYVAYCDEVNGYYLYTASTNTWAAVAAGAGAGQINGADPTKFVQVLNWKNRLWFVEKDTAQAWYLPVNQYAGTVASFGFGSKFPQGGALAAIANWTVDGGAGVDDQFVAVSNAGDVAVYSGTDPAFTDTFALRGYWNVGKVPPGRRFMLDAGGDMLVLSSRGLTSLVRLLSGSQSPTTPDFFLSFKIGNLIGDSMAAKSTLDGWSVGLHSRRNMIIISVPNESGEDFVQYAMYVPNGAWSVYRGIPILCQGSWNGTLYFGTADGRVCKHAGDLDGSTLTAQGNFIDGSGCTAFTDLGLPGRTKRVGLVRATVVSGLVNPAIEVQLRWDFDVREATAPSSSEGTAIGEWGTTTWDGGTWGGPTTVSAKYRGATGTGQRCAVAFRVSSTTGTTLAAIDVVAEPGGVR